jgi:type II secretory pathway component GspD/PulD (secretin)
VITLLIDQETTNAVSAPGITSSGTAGSGSSSGSCTSTSNILTDEGNGPTTSKTTTKTKVHLPDGYFLIISGMIQDDEEKTRIQVPCLGGAPFLGALFSSQTRKDTKRNLMIFIRPQLIDTEDEIRDLTRRQQNIFKVTRRNKPLWRLETEDALEWSNLQEETGCGRVNVFDFNDEAQIRETVERHGNWSQPPRGQWGWQEGRHGERRCR